MPDWTKIDPLALIKGGAIGAGVGLAAGVGITAAKGLRSKQAPASRDLSVQTLNLDSAAPDLIPTLLAIEEFVDSLPAGEKAAWRGTCGGLIKHCDQMYNILNRVARKEIRPEIQHVAEVEIWARAVCQDLDKLTSLLPEEEAVQKTGDDAAAPDSLETKFTAIANEIKEAVQAAWLNFKNVV